MRFVHVLHVLWATVYADDGSADIGGLGVGACDRGDAVWGSLQYTVMLSGWMFVVRAVLLLFCPAAPLVKREV